MSVTHQSRFLSSAVALWSDRILENAKEFQDNITGATYPQRGKFLICTVLKILKSLKFSDLFQVSLLKSECRQ